MDVIDYVVYIICMSVTLYIQLLYYSKLSNKCLDLCKVNTIFLLLIVIWTSTINTIFNLSFSRLIISFCLIFLTCYIVFKEKIIDCLIRSIVCFLVMFVFEILLSFIVMPFFHNIYEFKNDSITRLIFSVLDCLLTYLIVSRKFLIRFCDFIINKIGGTVAKMVILFIGLIITFLISHKYAILTYGFGLPVINICLLICFMLLFVIVLYNNYKTELIKREQEILLKFISNYEKLIDENREKLHEVHNDLLVLKSFENKNSKKYEKIIDEFINKYSKNGISYKNIYNLPSGLKGILYYKIYEMKELGITVHMHLSKKIGTSLEKVIKNDYVRITKIISILMDNAKDASSKSEEKEVLLDFSEFDNKIIMRIENSYLFKPNINKIYNKGYSSKGRTRGYGLYILKKIVESNKHLELKQSVDDNVFVSEFSIYKMHYKDIN